MLSAFYRKHSRHLLIAVALTFPILFLEANSIPNNNQIETWLPDSSDVRDVFNEFKLNFGQDEVVLIGVSKKVEDSGLADALSRRIELLPGIRRCWSPHDISEEMGELGVTEAESRRRQTGLTLSRNGDFVALMAILSQEGIADRADTIRDIKRELAYCQLPESDYLLSGGPVVITEMDRLGNKEESTKFFLLTLAVSAVLLYRTLRNWNLSLVILGLTLWGIQLTTAAVKWCGGEANFILSALSVMVMVFTLAVAVHIVHYFLHARGRDRLGESLRLAWWPCFLAMVTTAIGLASLTVSDMGPVRQFGWSAALGAIVSLLVGFGLTPAALTIVPPEEKRVVASEQKLARLAFGIVGRSRWVVAATLAVLAVSGWGLTRIRSRIEPLDFLPKDGKVRTDIETMQENLASASSIEAVVDFGGLDLPFARKLDYIRSISKTIESHPKIDFALSPATFFPDPLPNDPLAVMSLLETARNRSGQSDLIADGDRLWRISARLNGSAPGSDRETVQQLHAMTEGQIPIVYTGMEVLLEHAQHQIFRGFWDSFASAFAIITVIMMLSLRSVRAGLVAMIPNLTPIAFIFGLMGWMSIPVDIGTMMTGSIALGIAVDGTFHYLFRYNESVRSGESSSRSARRALLMTGGAIFNAALITALGMFVLVVSSFGPTSRFGVVMCALMFAAIAGDLVLLPALLSLKPEDRARRRQLLRMSDHAGQLSHQDDGGDFSRRKAS